MKTACGGASTTAGTPGGVAWAAPSGAGATAAAGRLTRQTGWAGPGAGLGVGVAVHSSPTWAASTGSASQTAVRRDSGQRGLATGEGEGIPKPYAIAGRCAAK